MAHKKSLLIFVFVVFLLASCQNGWEVLEQPLLREPTSIPEGMTAQEAATLASLEQVDDYPLYTMTYQGDYGVDQISWDSTPQLVDQGDWACSLFAVFGDAEEMLYGRNFDWDFSPGLVLFTDPEEGYASVSMVDLYYLGFGSERAFGMEDLPLEDLTRLLDAPYLPFDGLNEAGLAIGMAAVPDGAPSPDPEKQTLDSLLVMRVILDRAATITEAVEIIQTYNLDWGSGPALHYLVADASGRSVLIEFSGGEMVLLENQDPWQAATNFLVSEARTDPATRCWRYSMITKMIEGNGGVIQAGQAMDLLQTVSQENTQWSVVYRVSAGEVQIVMGRDYATVHRFPFPPQ